MTFSYSTLHSNCSNSVVSSQLTERHLHIIWLEQKYISSFFTHQSEEIEVISPGIWNFDAGPDFLKAHIRIGQTEYKGDIEIHLHDKDWFLHQHHLDSRYNEVVLHISYYQPKNRKWINKENGFQIDSFYLEKQLKGSLEELISTIDLELYPSRKYPGKGVCADKLFKNLSESTVRSFLKSAAYWRLENKLNFFENQFLNSADQLAAGLAMALGYKNNATAFLELFNYLMPLKDEPEEELLAMALGSCGFLEENRKAIWELSDHYQYLKLVWNGKKYQMLHQTHLQLHQIRPLNHPIRRIAYLVKFIRETNIEQFWKDSLDLWKQFVENEINQKQLKNHFFELIPQYSFSYWDHHFTFELKASLKRLPTIGEEFKMHVLLNTFLPLIYGLVRKNHLKHEWEKLQSFYISLKVKKTGKILYLQHRFWGENNKQFLNEAQSVQGMNQLHRDFCMHHESSCQGCPFVERFLKIKEFQ
ncbi:MAG: DUF2851 family protein [Parachlamydiaceae bacterium]|nr:DUF2851 family protein [Parachlamydiaceae bacterium]